MSLKIWVSILLALPLVSSSAALAQSEEERRKGFYEHRETNKESNREREAGLKAYLLEQAEWEEQRKKDREADKGRKKQESPVEGGPEYKADRQRKYEDYLEYQETRKAYVKRKKSQEAQTTKEQARRDAWALEEYGLDQERPRFDIAKRNLTGSRGGSNGRSGNFGGSSNFIPPPPAFDDFGNDGFVPPPFPPESFEPPPEGFPPPPPIPDEAGPMDESPFPPPPPPLPVPEGGR